MSFLANYPELITLLVAMSPIAETRASVPLALFNFGFSPFKAYIFSFLGNIIIPVFLILFMESTTNWLSARFHFLNRFFAWFFERMRKNHQFKVTRWQEFALFILVVIPLPFTGVWTASLVAFVFGIPLWRALFYIIPGSAVATFLVLLISMGFSI